MVPDEYHSGFWSQWGSLVSVETPSVRSTSLITRKDRSVRMGDELLA